MKLAPVLIAVAVLFTAPAALAETPDHYLDDIEQMSVDPAMETCFNCSKSDSKDKCKGFDQCRGDRKHCQKIGCKIVGTGSCSTAANVKICSWDGYALEDVSAMDVDPAMETCFNCSKTDSKDKCKGFDQCRGDRKHCQKIGCRIVGTGSCSTAANVKICSWDGYALEEEPVEEPQVSVAMCLE